MTVQIFGQKKCFDTKKAVRFFQERGVPFQFVDLSRYGISRGELQSVAKAVGLQELLNQKAKDAPLVIYLAGDDAKLEKLLERPELLRTPIVRCKGQAAVGYAPEAWGRWADELKK